MQRQPDITKAKEILNWEPKISRSEGMKRMRALTKGLSDVVAEVEADKQTLRDMPDTVNLSGATDYWTAYESVPNAFIDFEAKYNPKLV